MGGGKNHAFTSLGKEKRTEVREKGRLFFGAHQEKKSPRRPVVLNTAFQEKKDWLHAREREKTPRQEGKGGKRLPPCSPKRATVFPGLKLGLTLDGGDYFHRQEKRGKYARGGKGVGIICTMGTRSIDNPPSWAGEVKSNPGKKTIRG